MIGADKAEKDLTDASRVLDEIYDRLCLIRNGLPSTDERLMRALDCTALASLNCLAAAALVRKANGK